MPANSLKETPPWSEGKAWKELWKHWHPSDWF